MLAFASITSLVSAKSIINWNVATNLLQDATVVTSSTRAIEDQPINITDGNISTGWQAVEKANNVVGNPDWVIIDLGSKKHIADVEVAQQDALATKYDFYLVDAVPSYLSREINTGTEEAPNLVNVNYITDDWYTNNTPVYTHNEDEVGYDKALKGTNYDTHAVDAVGQYIVIVAKEYNVWGEGYGMKIWEVRATEKTSDIDSPKTITLSDSSVKNGQMISTTLTAITVGGKEINDISAFTNINLTISDNAAADIVDKGNGTFEITGKKVGEYTLTAKASLNGEEVTATAILNVLFSWDKATDVALNKTATASHNSANAYKAINGSGNGWEVGENITTGTWYQVDLGGDYKISAIGVQWETAYANHYKYYYATEKDGDGEPNWIELLEVNTYKTADNQTIFTDVFSEVTARYIKLECIQSQVWGMHFFNFKVAGVPSASPVPTTMIINSSANGLFIGESATITSVVKDQFGSLMDIAPELTITDGTETGTITGSVFTSTAKGTATITAKAGDLVKTIDIVIAADKNKYLIKSGASAITNTDENGAKAIDKDINTYVEFPIADFPSSITVKLDNLYILDMITIDWERACPADYTVTLATDEAGLDTNTPIHVVADRPDPNANIQDRIYGKTMKSVKYIKINMTKAATPWDVKLFEVSPYGVIDPATGVGAIATDKANIPVDVYSISGNLVRKSVLPEDATKDLAPGFYIVGKEKRIVK